MSNILLLKNNLVSIPIKSGKVPRYLSGLVEKAILILLFSVSVTMAIGIANAAEQPVSFSQSDRDRLIKTEVEITALRSEMNARFEQVDKRFEDANVQITEIRQDMRNLMLLFGGLVAATIGFAIWDRRTMVRPFETKVKIIDSAIEQLREEKTANKILTALRELAKKDMPLAEVLRTYNLL